MPPKVTEQILMALMSKQSASFNSSPFSQFVNAAGTEAGGKVSDAAQSIAQALMLPGDVAIGRTDFDPRLGFSGQDPVTLDRAAELAGTVGLSSVAIPRPMGSLGMGGSNFDNWFGGSKVRTPEGSPMTVYHGTGGNFDEFDLSKANSIAGSRDIGFHFGTVDQANTRAMMAETGGNIMPVNLSLQNPARLPDLGYWSPSNVASELYQRKMISYDDYVAVADGKKPIQQVMKDNGYDGIVYNNAVEGQGDSFIAIDPAQVKSATGNSGAYNPTDPSILRSSGLPLMQPDRQEANPPQTRIIL